jgi:hypothetical protein
MVERNRKHVKKFSNDTHIRCWKRYAVRPPGGAEKPELTHQQYCHYDKTHGDYLYTVDWIDFLVEK